MSIDNGTQTVRMRGRLSGWLLYTASKLMAAILAPGFDTVEGLDKAIAKNRVKGPARASLRIQRKFDCREEEREGGRVFLVSHRNSEEKKLHFLYLHGGAFILDLQPIQWAIPVGLLSHVNADMTIAIYPLAPEATWRETMAFNMSVYLGMVDKYGAENIVITGDSAGATIALLLAQSLRDQGAPQPVALVLFSGVYDLSASGADQPALARRDPSLSINLIRYAAEYWAPGMSPNDPRISALYASQEDLPPTLCFSGDREILDSDARRLKAANPTLDHRSYAEMSHVFPIGGTKEGKHAFEATATFIAEHWPPRR